MQNGNLKGSLAAVGTAILVTVALLGMKGPQVAPADDLDSAVVAPIVSSIGGIGLVGTFGQVSPPPLSRPAVLAQQRRRPNDQLSRDRAMVYTSIAVNTRGVVDVD